MALKRKAKELASPPPTHVYSVEYSTTSTWIQTDDPEDDVFCDMRPCEIEESSNDFDRDYDTSDHGSIPSLFATEVLALGVLNLLPYSLLSRPPHPLLSTFTGLSLSCPI
jgi:hypothetical protein